MVDGVPHLHLPCPRFIGDRRHTQSARERAPKRIGQFLGGCVDSAPVVAPYEYQIGGALQGLLLAPLDLSLDDHADQPGAGRVGEDDEARSDESGPDSFVHFPASLVRTRVAKARTLAMTRQLYFVREGLGCDAERA